MNVDDEIPGLDEPSVEHRSNKGMELSSTVEALYTPGQGAYKVESD